MKTRSRVLIAVWFVSGTWLFSIPRESFYQAWFLFTIAFISYVMLLHTERVSLRTGIVLMLAIRLSGFFFTPLLSDDYFRFIWDGWISGSGIHPMAYTPAFIMEHPEIITPPANLFQHLNSPDYFSVYPPIAEWLFTLAYKINGLDLQQHILFYKILLALVDAVIIYLMHLLLVQLRLPKEGILLYGLNPLIILEYSGNLHFDGLMIAGLLGAMVVSNQKNTWWLSLSMAFSVLSKMATLLLLPFVVGRWPWKKMMVATSISLLIIVIPFYLYAGTHTGWMESVTLWFNQFEFNAGIYYLLRELGHNLKGYNMISFLGPAMALMTILGLCWLWLRYRLYPTMSLPLVMLYAMTFYYCMGTTVHPWYIGIVLVLGILSQRLYPIVWTYLVFLSYSHYEGGLMKENYILIATEYLLLFAFMVWEIRIKGTATKSP